MSKRVRFIRCIAGGIYDVDYDIWYHEDYVGKPLDYVDDVVKLLNDLNDENGRWEDLSVEDMEHIMLLEENIREFKDKLGVISDWVDKKIYENEDSMLMLDLLYELRGLLG